MKDNKIAVLIAGCGYLDGAEINESIFTLLSLKLKGWKTECFSVDKTQADVINHLSGKPGPESERNCLEEAARICRGQVRSVAELNPDNYVGLAIPGGFGVAKNFCDFATKGADASVEPEVERVINSFLTTMKPILAVCIAPALVSLVAAKKGMPLLITLGSSSGDAAKQAKALGHSLVEAGPGDCVIDPRQKIVSTPAFMCDIDMAEAWPGIQKSVEAFTEFLNK